MHRLKTQAAWALGNLCDRLIIRQTRLRQAGAISALVACMSTTRRSR